MRNHLINFTAFCFLFSIINLVFAGENAFYILHSNTLEQKQKTQKLLIKLRPQANKINIIISQAYRIDSQGKVSGFVDDGLMKFARKHHIKLYALVTNIGFDKEQAHRFLTNPVAQARAIKSLVDACNKYDYAGIQFDFEGISIKDKKALTSFYTIAANVLHKKGYKVSFAVVPLITNAASLSEFQKRRYENWSGAYDLKVLGTIGDFISIMAYDQHTYGTLPGPIGGFSWVKATIEEALKYIPAKKLSLGIPVYSGYWVMANHPKRRLSIRLNQISYKEVKALQGKYHFKLKWDRDDKVYFSYFNHHWLYDYLFIENANSFKAKYNLMKKYKLRGISVFNLGNEDPDIWKVLS